MKKFLKITICTFLTLSLLVFVTGFLVFSYPFFLNTYANLLVKCSATEPNSFDYQTYSKEEFASKYLNTSLTPQDDFISLFKNHYGVNNSNTCVIVCSKLKDPKNSSVHTLYGIICLNNSCLNNSSSLVFKGDVNDPEIFNFQIYSKEEFASKCLNTTLTPRDDFISLFENYYGIENTDIMFIAYYIQDPEDRSIHRLYGINQCERHVFIATWKEDQTNGNNSELLEENGTENSSGQRNVK
ncbi:hypothetical protein MSBRW_3122 [Methanosarcina barkeri str. Wiesmoor]|uniref:Uncharacterized protein n=2 Tax=Methanosarcina barkeri TaxID=2208 RepID=A0A0E3QPF1_METBA|nr:hypothetical protein [Methanosarcina barkeri]AKB52375.1 hypothetical protein MSBRW_3122 [Methanosarcina barkeri str. Wiesmoor]